MQGDRFVIGSSPQLFARAKYTLTDLGMYSAAFGLAMVAIAGLTKITLSLMLPALAQAQNAPAQFLRRYSFFAQALGLTGALMAVGFMVVGKPLVVLVYGQQYAAAGALIGWLGAMQSIRIIRTAPTMAALAMGDTQNSLIANVARTSGLAVALAMATFGAPMTWLVISGLGAEVFALVVSAWRLRRQYKLAMSISIYPACLAGVGMALGWVVTSLSAGQLGWIGSSLAACAIAAGLVAAWFASLPADMRPTEIMLPNWSRRELE
jgi:O-antigen/teichoic acid export membrane protein